MSIMQSAGTPVGATIQVSPTLASRSLQPPLLSQVTPLTGGPRSHSPSLVSQALRPLGLTPVSQAPGSHLPSRVPQAPGSPLAGRVSQVSPAGAEKAVTPPPLVPQVVASTRASQSLTASQVAQAAAPGVAQPLTSQSASQAAAPGVAQPLTSQSTSQVHSPGVALPLSKTPAPQVISPGVAQPLSPGVAQTLSPGAAQTLSPAEAQTLSSVVAHTSSSGVAQSTSPAASLVTSPAVARPLPPGEEQTVPPEEAQTSPTGGAQSMSLAASLVTQPGAALPDPTAPAQAQLPLSSTVRRRSGQDGPGLTKSPSSEALQPKPTFGSAMAARGAARASLRASRIQSAAEGGQRRPSTTRTQESMLRCPLRRGSSASPTARRTSEPQTMSFLGRTQEAQPGQDGKPQERFKRPTSPAGIAGGGGKPVRAPSDDVSQPAQEPAQPVVHAPPHAPAFAPGPRPVGGNSMTASAGSPRRDDAAAAAFATGSPKAKRTWRGLRMEAVYTIGNCSFCVSSGSILDFVGDVIVSDSRETCLGVLGVDKKIADAGGPRLAAARKALPVLGLTTDGHRSAQEIRCPTGEARIVEGGNLKANFCMFAVGPNYSGSKSTACDSILLNTYKSAMACAQANSLESIAFTLLCGGVFRGTQSLKHVMSLGVEGITAGIYPGLKEVHMTAFKPEEVRELKAVCSVAFAER
eukprot:TRINITY_DN6447_c0_g1_i2.p1 TRINITY_DN6447_c0_g1~~TRINITY_DN6447_c0_g1_i2.p1  ORF type:complete len:692 (-),score=99.70 TRINITY_DN6447_c0_g1_i2:39-2114(-)